MSIKSKYGSVNKYPIESALTYNILLDTIDTITVLFKINDFSIKHTETTAVIYNTMYLSKYDSKTPKLFIDQICPSGSIQSRGGEYRSGLINWHNFKGYLSKHKEIKQLFNLIIDHNTIAFKERKIKLTTEYYNSMKSYYDNVDFLSSDKNIKKECDSYMIYIYSITWFNFYYEYFLNIISNNLNEEFSKVMQKYKEEDILALKTICKQFTSNDIEIFHYICNNTLDDSLIVNLQECKKIGQKLTVLNSIDYSGFFNIEHVIWRELSINTKVSDLIVNNITNGFSITNNWFLIQTFKSANFFDNVEQYDKIVKSKTAVKIINLLKRAESFTYSKSKYKSAKRLEDFTMSITNESKTKNEISEFNVLKQDIKQSINYAKEHFILSDIILNMISEHTGRTFYDTCINTSQNTIQNRRLPMYSDENYETFKKYMFEICYNLYCLNTRIHTIHGDLHFNNITVAPLFYTTKQSIISIIDPKILFIIDDDHQYIFNNNFFNICIIDFNGSIINPESYEDMDKTVPALFDEESTKDNLLKSQIKKLLTYLFYIKPEYKEYKNTIENNIIYHYSEYFKILSVLDVYNVTLKLLSFTDTKSTNIGKIGTNSIKLITRINTSANYYLTTVFEKLLNTTNYTEYEQMEWPVLAIIKEIFTDNLYTNTDLNIVDTYSYLNKNTNSLLQKKDFPTTLNKIADKFHNKLNRVFYESKKFNSFKYIKNILPM